MILENIRKLCAEKKVSIYALESATHLGNGTIARWNSITPSVDKVKKVADYFGVTVDELLKEATEAI